MRTLPNTTTEAVEDHSDIPDAPFYVHMRDRFMSGWGPVRGGSAYYVVVCNDRLEAEVVAANARGRSDQEDVQIVEDKPTVPSPPSALMVMDRESSARWYQPGSWTED